MLLKAPFHPKTQREHLLSASAPHEVTGRGSGKRRRWTERFGFYAAVTDASVGGNTSVFSSQESSEDLIICHLRHQSSAGERSAQILQRRSLLSVSRGCCAKRGGQPEKDIMSDRFDCKNCNESLCGRKYIQVEDNPHCIPCYDRLYANTCQECKEIIGHNAKELFYENRHYHAHCFRCFRCDRSLADEPFTSQEDALVCSDCYCNEFSSKCVACDKTVMPGSRMLEYAGSTWHEDCFACHGCEKPIGAEAFIPDKNNYYCVPCYEGRVAPQCSHCKKALTKGGVTYKDEIWHKECFLCTGCKAPLAGQPFTSQGECPYCVKCFSSLYAKKCAGCNTAITGFGDGKYISFEDRQWHQPCFKCSRCSVSLVGSGFFPDRDQILCSDCNNDD